MKTTITEDGWILIDKQGNPVLKGSTHMSFRNEPLVITGGAPPHKPGSTGRIYIQSGGTFTAEYYPSVCDLKWVENAMKVRIKDVPEETP